MTEDFHLREDLSRLENRINVALFGCLAVSPLDAWLKTALRLPPNSLIYPGRNFGTDEGVARPDYVVSDLDERTIARIEVECWSNAEQLERYRRIYSERIIAIWGTPDPRADLSLKEIATFVRSILPATHGQQRATLRYFLGLVDEIASAGASRGSLPAAIGDEMWDSTLVAGLRDRLGGRLTRFSVGQGDMRPGDIQVGTTETRDNRGYWVRVYSPWSTTRKSVSILNRTAGRPEVRISSSAWLNHYLRSHGDVVSDLGRLVEVMGGDIEMWKAEPTRDQSGRPKTWHGVPLPLTVVEDRIDEVAELILRFANRPRA